jgi:hypothetical protein
MLGGVKMAEMICQVSAGLRPSEATVMLRDFDGRKEFMPIERDFLSQEGERYYLPVSLLHIDEAQRAALIALPVEADSGANRIWVKLDDLRDYRESALIQRVKSTPAPRRSRRGH